MGNRQQFGEAAGLLVYEARRCAIVDYDGSKTHLSHLKKGYHYQLKCTLYL